MPALYLPELPSPLLPFQNELCIRAHGPFPHPHSSVLCALFALFGGVKLKHDFITNSERERERRTKRREKKGEKLYALSIYYTFPPTFTLLALFIWFQRLNKVCV